MQLCSDDIDSYLDQYFEASLAEMTEKQAQNYKNVLKFIMASIVQGLEDIHEKGKMLHKDIKPRNIMFDNDKYLKITDFGVA